ncbi:MAG: hypothetical protein GY774_24565, partial [Planctomycetes bacterium]|nr:hypothetical protein [Planctomycetota bacterium]
MYKKMIYLVSVVVLLGSISQAEDLQWTDLGADQLWSTLENWELTTSPIWLDIGNSHNAEELEEGFTSFTLDESGSDVDGITIEFG